MKRVLIAALAAMALMACDKAVNPNPGTGDQTDGRITIMNDPSQWAGRVTNHHDPVPIDTTLSKASHAAAFGIQLLTAVTPPVVSGQTLQATSVILSGNYAYVSYNMAGNPTIGAVDVVLVKGVAVPVLVTAVTYIDTDISSVAVDNNTLYLAEASGNPALSYTAAVECISLINGKLNIAKHFQRGLQSYVATSVFAIGGRLYVTTGNTGGLYTLAQNDTLPIQNYVPLHDARWVDGDNANIVVARGTPGALSVYDRASGTFVRSFRVPGMSIAESKSTVRLFGNNALVAAGDSGVQFVSITTGQVLGSIPAVLLPGLAASKTVTNAVDASGSTVFISNGEAGLYVAIAMTATPFSGVSSPISFATLGRLQVPSLQSVNHVAYDGQTLVAAAGIGGFKVMSVTF